MDFLAGRAHLGHIKVLAAVLIRVKVQTLIQKVLRIVEFFVHLLEVSLLLSCRDHVSWIVARVNFVLSLKSLVNGRWINSLMFKGDVWRHLLESNHICRLNQFSICNPSLSCSLFIFKVDLLWT